MFSLLKSSWKTLIHYSFLDTLSNNYYPQENPPDDDEPHPPDDEIFPQKEGAENCFFDFLEPNLRQAISVSASVEEKTTSSN